MRFVALMVGMNSVSASTGENKKKINWDAKPINVGVESPHIDMERMRASNARNLRAWRLAKFAPSATTVAGDEAPRIDRPDRQAVPPVENPAISEAAPDKVQTPRDGAVPDHEHK
jgi:hypothetical protein